MTARKTHPKAEGIVRIRIRHPRPAGSVAEILVVYSDRSEAMVGTATRTSADRGPEREWHAVLWADHPLNAEGHATRAGSAPDLAKSLTESVKAKGPWWE